jgi:HSP20 family molecular chaperone IbpA
LVIVVKDIFYQIVVEIAGNAEHLIKIEQLIDVMTVNIHVKNVQERKNAWRRFFVMTVEQSNVRAVIEL